MYIRNAFNFSLALVMLSSCQGTSASSNSAAQRADENDPSSILWQDPGSAQLAQMLAGYALVCGPSKKEEAAQEEKGFFPLTIRASDQGSAGTLLEVKTDDPKVGFGFGGDEFDPVEVTTSWTILGQG